MKLLDLIITANQNLMRNKVRSFLTILAIFVGSFSIILNSAINAGVNNFINDQVKAVGGDGFIEVAPSAIINQLSSTSSNRISEYSESSSIDFSSINIPEKDIEKMQKVDGVKNLETFHMLSPKWIKLEGNDKKYNIHVEYFPNQSFNADILAGRASDNNTNKNEIVLTEDWAKNFGLSNEDLVGKTVEIAIDQTAKTYTDPSHATKTVKATVVGVQANSMLSFDGDQYINKALDNNLYKISTEGLPKESKRTMVAVGEVDPEKIDSIRDEFKKIGSGYEFLTIDDMMGTIRTFLNIILTVLNVFGAIALLAAAIGIVNTLFMSVQERTREIGLSKALGMSKFKIFLSFSFEAIALGFWGSVLGVVVSMVLGDFMNGFVHQDGGLLANFPTFDIVKFTPTAIIPIVLIIMLIAFIAGTAPAIKAAKKNPIDALRYE